jgi:hypothetical protein
MTQRNIPHAPRTAANAAVDVRANDARTLLSVSGVATLSIAVLVLVVLISRLTGAG